VTEGVTIDSVRVTNNAATATPEVTLKGEHPGPG